MKTITILYGTETGTAEHCADRIHEFLTKNMIESRVVDMDVYVQNELPDEDFVLVVTSTYGDGDPPRNAVEMYYHLHDEKPNLSNVQYAVLALGDSSFPHFAQCGKDFDNIFEELGAERIIDRIECDCEYELELNEFQNKICHYLLHESEDYPRITTAQTVNAEQIEKKNIFSTFLRII